MSTHKYFDRICCVVLVISLLITVLFMNGEALGIRKVSAAIGYEERLFDPSKVHTIDIVMEDWDGFLSTCENEEYTNCSVVIDGEAYKNVGIRAKGNTSLSNVSSMNSDRYSFKIEFDQYDSTKSYYGLDKLCLNNIIQDNTYMKDFLTYRMMGAFGVAAPLCSYVSLTVGGESFGLYLAVEAVEESFLQRNYGSNSGKLYKPDSMDMGGGRGNGRDFDFTEWESERTPSETVDPSQSGNASMPDRGNLDPSRFGGAMPGSRGSDDVSLLYTDDDYDSYSNIFDNAKTDLTDADKDRLIASLKRMNEQTDLESAVEIEQVIRYFVVHNFVLNFDSYTGSMIHNYYLYESDGRLSMIPWDYNLAFGGFESGSDATSLVNYPIDTPVSGGTTESRPMLAWIFSEEAYTEQYHALFAEFLDQVDILGMIEQTKELIAPYVGEDPTAFCSYDEFVTGADTLYEFCALRIESIKGQLFGSIGSTDETQAKDTLIDAGDMRISDMGSMGNMGGGNQPDRGQNTNSFLRSGSENTVAAEELSAALGAQMQRPDDQNFDPSQMQPGEMPEGFDPSQMQPGEMPEGFDPSQMQPGEMPEGFDPSQIQPGETSSEDDTQSVPEQGETTSNPDMSFDRGTQDTNRMPTAGSDENGESGWLLLLSVVVLVGGLIFAKWYPYRQ